MLATIEANDIFDELSHENHRLNSELTFANKSIDVLNKFKSHLNKICDKYDQTIDAEDKNELKQLNRELEDIINAKENIEIEEHIREPVKTTSKTKSNNSSANYFLNKRLGSLKSTEDIRRLCMTREEREQCFDSSMKSYRCPKPMCTYSGPTNKSLNHHLYFGHRKPDILCSFPGCKRLFKSTNQLKEHLSKHLGIKSLSCDRPDCDYKTSSKSNLKAHKSNHSEHRPHRCTAENCNKSFKTVSGLNAHMELHRRPNKPVPTYVKLLHNCHILRFKNQESNSPNNSHNNDVSAEEFTANNNDDIINTKRDELFEPNEPISELEQVYQSINDQVDQVNRNDQDTEPKKAKNGNVLEWMLTREEREQCFDPITNSYKCPKPGCNSICITSRHLYHHFYSAHRERDILCKYPGCDRAFRNTSALSEHLKKHFNIKPFACQYDNCQYRTSSKNNLTHHMRAHSNIRLFECTFTGCSKSFKCEPRLKEHMFIHSEEMNFKCPFEGCGQCFRTPGQLQYHKNRFHLGKTAVQKLQRCDWPGCDFEGKSLISHKLAHTGEKPFLCEWPLCGKRFRLKATLKDHQNIHKNNKPYACHWPGCGYRCSNSGNIRKHVVHCHNGNSMRDESQ